MALQQVKTGFAAPRPVAPTERPTRTAQITHFVLVIGVCAVLGFGPLAFGAVQPWAICVLEVGTSIVAALWAVREVALGRFQVYPNLLYVPVVLFAGLVAIQLLFHRTAYWYVTWSKAWLWVAYAGIFFLVLQIFNRTIWLRGFGLFCAGYGFLMSLFAIIQQFTWNGKIYWIVPNSHGGWVYGPYVNHAHYAGLMEMLIPFSLIFGITETLRRSLRALFLFAAIVMSSTIFLSQSVGGVIAFAAELVALMLFLFWRKRSYREVVLLGVICCGLVVWLVWLRPVGLFERLARLLNPIADAGATGRVAIVKDSIKMVGQRPFLGWGLGTFPIVYPSFRSFFTNFWVNEAHNDFVQILVETGIVGFAFAASFLFRLCIAGIRNVRHWRNEGRASVMLAAFLGCIGFMVHSLFDFNLQIPANAAFFFALSALAAMGSQRPSHDHMTSGI